MRLLPCLVCAALIALSAAAPAQAQSPTTQTGSVSKGTASGYTFTNPASGQIIATLSWDVPAAHLIMALVCGASDPESFGIAAGLQDRVARFEAGVVAGEICALVVTSIDETANFRLHVMRSGDQALTPAPAGSIALSEARRGTLLSDEAERILDNLKRVILR